MDDKALHFQAGLILALSAGGGVTIAWRGRFHELAAVTPFAVGFVVAVAAGWAKEYLVDNVVDNLDWWATVKGGFVGASISSFASIFFIFTRKIFLRKTL